MRVLGVVITAAAAWSAAGCGRPPPPAPPPAPAAAAAPPVEATRSEVAERLGELFERGMRGGDEASLAEAFRELRAMARPDELPFVDRVEELAREMQTAGDDVDALLRAMVVALADLEALAPDLETRLAVAHQAHALAVLAAGEPSGPGADALALASSERLVRDHAADPRAWALRGHVLRRIAEDLRGALVAARRCAPSHPPCAALATQLTLEIEVPRCAAKDLRPGFALHRGTRQGRHEQAPREVMAGGAPMWIADAPAIVAADVAELAGDGTALLVTLTPAAAPKLEAFRTQVAWIDTAATILVEGQPVGAAEGLLPSTRGKLLLRPDPRAPLHLDAMCTQIVRDRAPP